MCGLFGIINKPGSKVDPGDAVLGLMINCKRGNQAVGSTISTVDGGTLSYKIAPGSLAVENSLKDRNFWNSIAVAQSAIFHTRFGTGGDISNVNNAHPFTFSHGGITLHGTHNGWFKFPEQTFVNQIVNSNFDLKSTHFETKKALDQNNIVLPVVDSGVFYYGLFIKLLKSRGKIDQEVLDYLAAWHGAAALAFYIQADGDNSYYIMRRQSKPLNISFTKTGIMYSSLGDALPGSHYVMPENRLFRIVDGYIVEEFKVPDEEIKLPQDTSPSTFNTYVPDNHPLKERWSTTTNYAAGAQMAIAAGSGTGSKSGSTQTSGIYPLRMLRPMPVEEVNTRNVNAEKSARVFNIAIDPSGPIAHTSNCCYAVFNVKRSSGSGFVNAAGSLVWIESSESDTMMGPFMADENGDVVAWVKTNKDVSASTKVRLYIQLQFCKKFYYSDLVDFGSQISVRTFNVEVKYDKADYDYVEDGSEGIEEPPFDKSIAPYFHGEALSSLVDDAYRSGVEPWQIDRNDLYNTKPSFIPLPSETNTERFNVFEYISDLNNSCMNMPVLSTTKLDTISIDMLMGDFDQIGITLFTWDLLNRVRFLKYPDVFMEKKKDLLFDPSNPLKYEGVWKYDSVFAAEICNSTIRNSDRCTTQMKELMSYISFVNSSKNNKINPDFYLKGYSTQDLMLVDFCNSEMEKPNPDLCAMFMAAFDCRIRNMSDDTERFGKYMPARIAELTYKAMLRQIEEIAEFYVFVITEDENDVFAGGSKSIFSVIETPLLKYIVSQRNENYLGSPIIRTIDVGVKDLDVVDSEIEYVSYRVGIWMMLHGANSYQSND